MKKRHAEIVGAGFAGLTAACALAQRGWSVRVHERADRLRTTGAGIYIYENGLRVLEAVGAYDAAVQGAPFAHTREVRDGQDRLISVHRWTGSRVFSIVARPSSTRSLPRQHGRALRSLPIRRRPARPPKANCCSRTAVTSRPISLSAPTAAIRGCAIRLAFFEAEISGDGSSGCYWTRPKPSAHPPTAPRRSNTGRARGGSCTRRAARPTSILRSPC